MPPSGVSDARVQRYVETYGEAYRALIVDALLFLGAREAAWRLDQPIDRDAYIAALLAHPITPPEVSHG